MPTSTRANWLPKLWTTLLLDSVSLTARFLLGNSGFVQGKAKLRTSQSVLNYSTTFEKKSPAKMKASPLAESVSISPGPFGTKTTLTMQETLESSEGLIQKSFLSCE